MKLFFYMFVNLLKVCTFKDLTFVLKVGENLVSVFVYCSVAEIRINLFESGKIFFWNLDQDLA